MTAMGRRSVLLPILVYLTLDLSLAEMPGAFVFDLSDSVESIQVTGSRMVTDVVVVPAPPAADPLARSRLPLDVKPRLAPVGQVERRGPVRAGWWSRALDDHAPPSEDPH